MKDTRVRVYRRKIALLKAGRLADSLGIKSADVAASAAAAAAKAHGTEEDGESEEEEEGEGEAAEKDLPQVAWTTHSFAAARHTQAPSGS